MDLTHSMIRACLSCIPNLVNRIVFIAYWDRLKVLHTDYPSKHVTQKTRKQYLNCSRTVRKFVWFDTNFGYILFY